MKILFLTPEANILTKWLEDQGERITVWHDKLTRQEVERMAPDMILSYNYSFLLPPSIFVYPALKTINLHISYLPWNRGADPNPWSHLENTPKGVSIHLVDEGIDTGPVICQREVFFDDQRDTLRTSYEKLQLEIQRLFRENWPIIRGGSYQISKQSGAGSFHRRSDRIKFSSRLEPKGWDTLLQDFKRAGQIA
ncbi:MAG: formyl transferase [Candidatus Omnitrophica bacterium]|nr:formyl transferase [Candidatus Omnitrophota bacterium]